MTNSDALGKLIRACVDDWRTLAHEATLVDAATAATLMRLAREREQFAADLERLAQHEQPHEGSWSELSREAERNLWVAAAGRNRGDAIRSCRHSRARTEAIYDEALEASWPSGIHGVLVAHKRRLHDDADALNKLQF